MDPYYDTMIAPLLSPTDLVVIAHRGGSGLRPENTMAAFDHAVSLGVDGLECDVHLSADGEPVIIHDATLDRTTDATGPVRARTAADLARVDAGARFESAGGFPYRGAGLGVPRLADLLARHPQMPVVIEIKGDAPGDVPRVLETIRVAGAEARVLIGSFSLDVLEAVRRQAPDIPTSAAGHEVQAALRRARFHLRPRVRGYRLIQAPFRLDGRQIFGRAFVSAVRRAGIPVQAWIVDAEQDMRDLIAWGVTGLISDRPDTALQVAATLRPERAASIG